MLTTVTATSWGISYTSVDPIFSTGSARDDAIRARDEGRAVTLNVSSWDSTVPNRFGGHGVVTRHPEHDGKTFPDQDAARDYCLHHGLLRVWTAADQARAIGRAS
jgi:hypothetical protein